MSFMAAWPPYGPKCEWKKRKSEKFVVTAEGLMNASAENVGVAKACIMRVHMYVYMY